LSERARVFECNKCGKRFTELDEEDAFNEGYETDPEHNECPQCYTYDKDLGEIE